MFATNNTDKPSSGSLFAPADKTSKNPLLKGNEFPKTGEPSLFDKPIAKGSSLFDMKPKGDAPQTGLF